MTVDARYRDRTKNNDDPAPEFHEPFTKADHSCLRIDLSPIDIGTIHHVGHHAANRRRPCHWQSLLQIRKAVLGLRVIQTEWRKIHR